jgi:hypothetical protein
MCVVSQFDLSFFNPEEVGETSSGFPEAPRKGSSHPFGAFSTKLRHYHYVLIFFAVVNLSIAEP